MNCCICYDSIENDLTKSNLCECNLQYHLECYKLMVAKNKYDCAYCRNSVVLENRNRNDINDILFHYVFSFPPIIALPLWFIVSILFVIFFVPFLFPKEIYNFKIAILFYSVYLYFLYLFIININGY